MIAGLNRQTSRRQDTNQREFIIEITELTEKEVLILFLVLWVLRVEKYVMFRRAGSRCCPASGSILEDMRPTECIRKYAVTKGDRISGQLAMIDIFSTNEQAGTIKCSGRQNEKQSPGHPNSYDS